MRTFFKIFFACLLALVIFTVVGFFVTSAVLSSLVTKEKEVIDGKAVLVIDLSESFQEVPQDNLLDKLRNGTGGAPSVYDVVRLIDHARNDSAVKGIYIKAGGNSNGFGTSEDIRNALLNFKSSGKFIYAYAEVIPQRAYHVANVADRLYCNPQGGVEWHGFSSQMAYLKGTLEKLEIKPQIFYAGKFKSATEPFREYHMTEANRIQTTALLHDMYAHFLKGVSDQRKLDTASLHGYADQDLVQFASDAEKYKLVDGLRFDDQVKDEIKAKLKLGKFDKINFVTLQRYQEGVYFKQRGTNKIAIIYAQGNIVGGNGDNESIGSDNYIGLIRKARLDNTVKAIVLRINSGGGSSLASSSILREMELAKKDKPVVVSFGDVAASGAYYLACKADSIFAQPNTITGSIGVFTMIPDMEKFFNNKLGMTFDEVSTSPNAGMLTVVRPLTEMQKRMIQVSVDSTYKDFVTAVASGRKKDTGYIYSIAQGRIWSGTQGVKLGLVDRIGGVQDAVNCAARMARLNEYRLREYPEPENWYEMIFGGYKKEMKDQAIREEIGSEGLKTYQLLNSIKGMMGQEQARMLYTIDVN
jgi:protease IV